MDNYKRIGVTKGEYGEPGYMHLLVKITEEKDKMITERVMEHLNKTGEESISNEDKYRIVFEVLEVTREKD